MNLDALLRLPDTWRDEADRYERDGVPGHAALLRRAADDLTDALDRWWLEKLTLEEGAAERGCAYDTLQKKVANGDIPNAGRPGRPRVRRCDLHDDPKPRRVGSGDREAEVIEDLTL
jgi:hypothetical protein